MRGEQPRTDASSHKRSPDQQSLFVEEAADLTVRAGYPRIAARSVC
jgi:hypothetical protein